MMLMTVGAILAAALAVPGPAFAGQPAENRGSDQTIEQVEREIERVAESVQREVARALEGHEQDVEAIVREVERLAENLAADVARSLEHTLESVQQSQEERAREQAERERQRAIEQAERAAEEAARIHERAREQAERDRERAIEQAERDRERAREQAERAKRRAAEQAERNRARAEQQGRSVETERTTRTIKIGPNGDLNVSNLSGDIVLSRASGNELTVEIVKTARAESAEAAKALLPLVHVDVIERGNRVDIRTRYEPDEAIHRSGRHRFNVSVGMNIAAPAGTRVSVRSMSGSITSKGIQGELSAESMSGSIRIANGGRVTGAKTMSGDVEVTGTQTDGTIDASSGSGSVTLKGVKARALDVGSISGPVLLDDVSAQRVEAQTVSGTVRLTGTLVDGGRYELNSHSGDIEVGVAGGAGFEVEATSVRGSIHTDFPIKGENRGFGRRSRSLHGVVGNGNAVLELTTFSGSIAIRKR